MHVLEKKKLGSRSLQVVEIRVHVYPQTCTFTPPHAQFNRDQEKCGGNGASLEETEMIK